LDKQYFLVVDGEKLGPYQRDQLIEAGMERDSLVWFEGCTVWVRAGKIPDLATLLDEQRKARKQLRKERRTVRKLPAPGTVRWLFRAAMCAHVPTTLFYVLGTTSLLTAIILGFILDYELEGARRPEATLARVYTILLYTGLITCGVALPCAITEAVLMVIFVRQCRRIVNAVSPDAEEESLISEVLQGFSIALPFEDAGPAFFFLWLAFGILALCICVAAIIFLLAFALAMVALLAVGAIYITVANQINKLTHGLNRVLEHYQMDVPRLSVRLSYLTSLSALLLIFGPLSIALFVLLPIWAYKTAAVAIEISERRREAVEGPPVRTADA
jgi:hypothetical protein